MTDRQRHVLEIMADPVNQVTSLSDRDREAISAALARIDELEHAGDCPECRGTGNWWYGMRGFQTCPTCKGTGKRPRRGKAGPQPYYCDDDL